jgi:uncharacterized protein YbjT (DUF2867 family)
VSADTAATATGHNPDAETKLGSGDPIHVIGASGRSGAATCRALLNAGRAVVPVVRNAGRWAATGLAPPPRFADLDDSDALRAALGDAAVVVSCAHARHAPRILAAAPDRARFVLLGSTRKFTRWPDAHGAGVIAGEAAFLASGRPGVMLHPTMIYGAEGEDNVRRLATLLRRLPLVPLPGGGRALVQPIHQGDVTRAILAAIDRAWDGPTALTIAGPSPLPYAGFVRAVAAAAGLPPPRIVAVPGRFLVTLAPLFSLLPGLPSVRAAEMRRLLEDKAFDTAPMRSKLGIVPIPLEEGLALTLGCQTDPML